MIRLSVVTWQKPGDELFYYPVEVGPVGPDRSDRGLTVVGAGLAAGGLGSAAFYYGGSPEWLVFGVILGLVASGITYAATE